MERLTNPFFFVVKTLFHSSPLIVSHYGVTNFPRDSTLLKWNNWTERPESAPPTTFPSKLNKFLFWLLCNKLFIGTGMDEHGDRSHQRWLIMVVPRPPGILLLLQAYWKDLVKVKKYSVPLTLKRPETCGRISSFHGHHWGQFISTSGFLTLFLWESFLLPKCEGRCKSLLEHSLNSFYFFVELVRSVRVFFFISHPRNPFLAALFISHLGQTYGDGWVKLIERFVPGNRLPRCRTIHNPISPFRTDH